MSGERGLVLDENHSIHRLHLKHSAEEEKVFCRLLITFANSLDPDQD